MAAFLEISDVSVRFKPDARRVLQSVTLPVAQGEWVASGWRSSGTAAAASRRC